MNIDIRNLQKWLNEEQEAPIDRQALARVLARAEQPAQPQQEPEIVQRVKRRTGKTIRTARNPNITARECIELADWIAANTSPPAQPARKPLTRQQVKDLLFEAGYVGAEESADFINGLRHGEAAHGIKGQA